MRKVVVVFIETYHLLLKRHYYLAKFYIKDLPVSSKYPIQILFTIY